jgi:transglutaminase-like putative cysteine protease
VYKNVSADLRVAVDGPARLAIQVAVADPTRCSAHETIDLTVDGAAVDFTEVPVASGGRLWVLDAQPGELSLSYRARVDDPPAPEPAGLKDELTYLRPSRYCESDRMTGLANRLFAGVEDPKEVLAAVSSWVGTHLEYVSGSSGPTDGAVDTLLAGRGVCRDYAHLAVCLLRGMGIPARLAAVYAPGLSPMDFHAVAEALIDGTWYVVDGTLLAPRRSLVRIATGRDAADTSFLSSYGGQITMTYMEVTATVEGDLPVEDVKTLISLG